MTLPDAAALFNAGRFTEFQDALEALAAETRAASERQFYTVLRHVAEAMHKLGNEDFAGAEERLTTVLRRLDEFMPRFRGLNVDALREDCRRLVSDLREMRAGRRPEVDPARLPRLRFLPE